MDKREITARLFLFGDRTRDARNIEIAPGAIRLSSDKLPLRLEHEDVIGSVLSISEDELGGIGKFRVSETTLGNDAWQLVKDDALSKVSIGFLAHEVEDGLVTEAELVEVSLVGVPAFRNADILEAATMEETKVVETEEVETFTKEEVNDLIEARFEELDKSREIPDAPEVDPATVTTKTRSKEYLSIVDLMQDTNAVMKSNDQSAMEKLTGALDSGIVTMQPGQGAVIKLAFPTPALTSGDASGVVPPGYIPDLLEILRQGRRLSATFASRSLPVSTGVTLPLVDQATDVDYQAVGATEVANQNLGTDTESWEIVTLAGGQGVTLQTQRFTSPDYMDAVVRDLLAAYTDKLNLETIVGLGTGTGPHATIDGVLNNATQIDAGAPDIAAMLIAIGEAAASVYGDSANAGTARWPTFIVMTPARWGWAIGQSDSEGRPLVTQDSPQNPIGTGDATVVGTFRGLNVIVDYDIPLTQGGGDEDSLIVSNAMESFLYEDSAAPAQIALTYPDVLVTDVSVFGFSTLAIRRNEAWTNILGLPPIT